MARVTGHIYPEDRKRGTVWYMSYRYASGKQERKLIGDAWTKRSIPPEGFYREVDAQEVLDEKLTDLRRGAASEPKKRSGKTFKDGYEEWLRFCRDESGLAASTLRDYERVAKGALEEEFGDDAMLEDFTEETIDTYRTKMLSGEEVAKHGGFTVGERKDGQPISRRTAQKRLVLLGGIFKRAREKKWISEDPCAEVKPIKLKASGAFNVLTVQQVEAVAAKAGIDLEDDEAELFRAAIIVAAYTGLRAGELRALRWLDVDFTNATIHVRTNKPSGGEEKAPKSDEVRSVPLMDDAAAALDGLSLRKHHTGPFDRVFVGEDGVMLGDEAFRDALYAAMEAAGIDRRSFPARKGFAWHDLRHTFGTLAVQVWPLSDVQAYMGHADIKTTMKYAHHVPKTGAAKEFSDAVRRLKDIEAGMPVTV